MLGNSHLLTQPGMRQACFQPVAQRHVGIVRNRARTFKCRAEKGDKPSKTKQDEYVEALKKGGVDQSTARKILDTWKQAGAESNPNQLRKLFLRQSLVPITASVIQLLVDAAAAYSIFLSAGFFALGPPFYARDFVVLLLDLLALYFATGCLFDLVTLTSVLISAAKLGTAPDRFYEAVKAIASPPGSSNEGLTVIQKAKAAVSAVKVAQALDAIAGMLESSVASNQASAAANSKGAAGRSIDTLTNLSAYLTLYRAEYQGGFDPSSVGMSESEAADLALKFGMYDLDDNGKLDSNEFVKMLDLLGANVSSSEAEAAMQVVDTNKNGYIEFEEFAKWWAGRKKGANDTGRVAEQEPAVRQ